MNRRHFIKVASIAGGAVAFGIYLRGSDEAPEKSPVLDGLSPWLFVNINEDNRIEFITYKQELGQGTSTGVAMLFAEELGADWNLVSIRPASLDHEARTFLKGKPWGEGVGGSSGLRRSWVGMREAGAAVKQMFLQAAARTWGVDSSACRIENSIVHSPSGQTLTLGALAAEAAKSDVPQNVTLKSSTEFKIIGKSLSNLYQKDYVTGSMEYTIDVKLPNMVYAAIARCPVYHGKLISFDDSKVRTMPGVLDIIEIPEFQGDVIGDNSRAGVAVIANSTWQAFEAKKALKIEWDFGSLGDRDLGTIEKEIESKQKTDRKVLRGNGNIDEAFANASDSIEAEYTNHYQEHGLMEPMVAVAHFQEDHLEVWTPTQSANFTAEGISRATNLPSDRILIHARPAGGSFGRKWSRDYTNEVAFLASKLSHPVKLTWTREDCTQNGHYHPYTHFKIKASIDSNQQVSGMEIDSYKTARRTFRNGIHYLIPNFRNYGSTLEMLVENGAWRSVGEHRDTFAVESFVDELSHHLSQDPLEFRLGLLPDLESIDSDHYRYLMARARRVLENARDLSDWSQPLPPGSGRGVALGRFNNTFVAQVATVHMNDDDITVEKIVCVADSGQVLNPQMAKGQLEGGILWGLTALMHGGIDIQNGQVQQSNFDNYPLIRMNEIPEMDIHLLESEGPIGGFGEPGVPPLAPSVLNAIFAASGKRIRSIPIRKDNLAAIS